MSIDKGFHFYFLFLTDMIMLMGNSILHCSKKRLEQLKCSETSGEMDMDMEMEMGSMHEYS